MSSVPSSSSARSRIIASPRWPGSDGAERIGVAEAVAVVGHAQLEARVDRAQRERDRVGARMAPGVDDRLLGDAEQHPGDLRRQVDRGRSSRAPRGRSAASRSAGSSRSRSRRTAPRTRRARGRPARRAATRMLRSVSSRASSSRRAASSPRPSAAALRADAEHHVEPDQLLDRAVVDRLGHAAPHLGLGLDRAPRQAARPQPAGGLGGAQAADDQAGGDARRARRRSRRRRARRWAPGCRRAWRRPATSATEPSRAIMAPRVSPWKWAWAAIRNSAAARTAP